MAQGYIGHYRKAQHVEYHHSDKSSDIVGHDMAYAYSALLH